MIDPTPGDLAQPKKYGILQVSTNTWLGTSEAPLTYDDEDLAKVARQVLAARIPCPVTDLQVLPFESADVKMDEIVPKYSVEEALDLIDKRGF